MSLTDTDRIIEEAHRPRVLALHFALARLRSTISFMNTGAHPDDETSAMLAALGFRDGLDLSYACTNRGEGGQNDIGTEATEDLGILRTAEMERAAEVLDLRLYWLSESPDDTLFDFGFSKSGTETFRRWDRARTLRRFVEIVRAERPDILCPTFLDVPGQHGHHRAMTEAAHLVMDLVADPGFETPGLLPWQPAKLYLPAWGGGGDAYDDESPPPPATLSIEASGVDPVSGWSHERIGQQSRRFHATQGMGRWVAAGEERDWPLHLVRSVVAGPDIALSSGLPASLGELARYAGADELAAPLAEAQAAIEAALASPFAFDEVLAAATRALIAVRRAREVCPAAARDRVIHRLARKESQLSRVIRLAAGVDVRGRLRRDALRPGDETTLDIEWRDGGVRISVTPRVASPWTVSGPLEPAGSAAPPPAPGAASPSAFAASDGHPVVTGGAGTVRHTLRLERSAAPSDPYPTTWSSDEPALPALDVRIEALGASSVTRLPLESPPLALPATSAAVTPNAWLLNLSSGGQGGNAREPSGQGPGTRGEREPDGTTVVDAGYRHATRVADIVPPAGVPAFDLPAGWRQSRTGDELRVHAPKGLEEGLYELPLTIDGRPAFEERRVDYPHVRLALRTRPASLQVRALDVALPDARVGYVGGGNDRVGYWLHALGVDVVELGTGALEAEDALETIDTLVVGLFALRTRPDLVAVMPRVHRWVRRGGHLLTLYHRPWDGWDADRTAPRRLEIGQPSLRWRVTDERAEVTVLRPDHPLLNAPNRIGPMDWEGWHKERGLYFASAWDEAYVPLLSMGDPDESPHQGSLLSAEIDKGRHSHTSLILHHQMECLVPGAFRLMANLVA